jgi:hypothetical protein
MNKQEDRMAARAAGVDPIRPCSAAWTLVGAALLAHAAAVLAGAFDLPLWVPVLECLVASLVGIRQLRRVTAATDEAASKRSTAPSTELREAVVWSPPPRFPARMAAPREDAGGPAAGT